MEHHGLNHIHIVVRDLERSVRFYSAFGFVKAAERDDLHFLVRPGTAEILTLRLGDAHRIDHFGLMLRDASTLDDAIKELEEAGGRLVERMVLPPLDTPSAILEDPDGYRVQI